MNLKNFKLDLPKTWREASRAGNNDQIVIRVYHINPLSRIDPKRLQDQSTPSDNPNITITKIGIPTTGVRPLEDFYKGMKAAIASGFMSSEWTSQKLDKLWKGMTETPHGERPGESDLASDIEIIQCPNEEFAEQTLKNKALMPTQGFNVPIPGGITATGMPKNMTMSDILQSDILKKYVPKNQWSQLEKMRSVIKEVQTKIPEVKQNFQERGIKFGEGKYLGCKAMYFESPNPSPPPKEKSSSNKDSSGTGGGGYGSLELLPKAVQPYSKINTFYLGLLLKNFIIGGHLLSVIQSLPLGKTFCYSLTKTKEVTTTTREGGVAFKDISIVPLVSNYANEGYFNKEEAEEIYKKIISKLNKAV